jgi:hypothetical protein
MTPKARVLITWLIAAVAFTALVAFAAKTWLPDDHTRTMTLAR